MTPAAPEIGGILVLVVATVREILTGGSVPMLSLLEYLTRSVGLGVAQDIGRLKEAKLRKAERAADLVGAQALKTLAEAAKLANATGPTPAPAPNEAARSADAALSVLAQHGGGLFVDGEALRRILERVREPASIELSPAGGVILSPPTVVAGGQSPEAKSIVVDPPEVVLDAPPTGGTVSADAALYVPPPRTPGT